MGLKILGVMTGTSCDGLDAACVEFEKDTWRCLWQATRPYPDALRKKVLEFQKPGQAHSSMAWMSLHRDLGIWYGRTLKSILSRQAKKPHLIANHGQTLAHFPSPSKKATGQGLGMSLQMGDPTQIAQITGLSVISNFRDGDLSAGGQGAPLAPGFHKLWVEALRSKNPVLRREGISIHNLGGISNLTYLPPQNRISELFAFDTGPANCWIDAAVEEVTDGKLKFDPAGEIALHNRPNLAAVKKILLNPYFLKVPPKSTGRDDFPYALFRKATPFKGPSLVATATAITVESIAQAYEKWIIKKGLPLHKIYLTGGGAKNLAISEGLQQRLPKLQILDISKLGISSEATEALAFAFLGYQTLLGNPLGGSWTGVRTFGSPGHIIPGRNWSEVLKKLSAH